MTFRILVLLFTIPFVSKAQTPEEDQINFESAADWLDSKLNYIYYDKVGEKWWNNTFYVNDKKEVTIKHISSIRPNTAKMQNKAYTIRSFKIQDINPQSLKVTEIEETKGRLVKGKMLELRTFGFQDLIHKTINNRRGSSTSFLFLSFPQVLDDSISNYAEIAQEKFHQAIYASTRVYPAGDDSDVDKIFGIVTGDFKTKDGQAWNAEQVLPKVLKIETASGIIQYFGFNKDKKQFYLLKILSSGFDYTFFQLSTESRLSLSSDSSQIFQFNTLNSFIFKGQEFFRE